MSGCECIYCGTHDSGSFFQGIGPFCGVRCYADWTDEAEILGYPIFRRSRPRNHSLERDKREPAYKLQARAKKRDPCVDAEP